MSIGRKIGKWLLRRDRQGGDLGVVEQALSRLADGIGHADPETERQWQMLRTRMDGMRSAARRPLFGNANWLLRPAAAAAGLTLLLLAANQWFDRGPAQLRFATARGERSNIVLADSSEVILNHTSVITVSGEGKNGRNVELAGEAFFRVRKSGSPFVVATAVGAVEVLGTEFNVRVREDRLEVAVVSGTVQVSAAGPRDLQKRVLPAGTIIAFRKNELPPQPEPLLFAEYPGWIHRKLLFQRTPLRAVCAEIEAMFDVVVRIEANSVAEERVSGALDSRSAGAALAALAGLSATRLRHDANAYVIY